MKAIQTNLLSIGLILAWLVSPESLVVVDRGAGLAGMNMIAASIVGAALALAGSLVIHDRILWEETRGRDLVLLQRSLGRPISLALLLVGRIPILLFASTGMLVTAGFSFNEVFIYWFPNFLFASVPLAVVALLNCVDEKHALRCQFIAVFAIAAGVLILIVLGIFREVPAPHPYQMSEPFQPFVLVIFGFLIFLGFDFHRLGGGSRPVFLALVPALVIVSLWVMTAVRWVEGEKLARSMVAYMSIARSVGGDSGHLLMGGIIICGVFCGVNGFFLAGRRMLQELAGERLFFSTKYAAQIYVGVMMLIIGIMMMAGLAGDRTIELQIRGALILWMISLGTKTITAGRLLLPVKRGKGVAGHAVGGIILLFAVILVNYAENSWYVCSFVLLTTMAAVLLSLIWVRMADRPSGPVLSEEDMP